MGACRANTLGERKVRKMSHETWMAIAFWILAAATLITFASAIGCAVPRIRKKEPDVPGTMAADFLPGFALLALVILAPGGRGMGFPKLALLAILCWIAMYAAIRFGSLSHANPENRGPRKT